MFHARGEEPAVCRDDKLMALYGHDSAMVSFIYHWPLKNSRRCVGNVLPCE